MSPGRSNKLEQGCRSLLAATMGGSTGRDRRAPIGRVGSRGSFAEPVTTQESDDTLIERCRKGDADAWRRLVDRYQRLVYSIPLNYGASAADAADITQITFAILIQSLDDLREGTRLAPWLGTVARRHTWRLLERSRREAVGTEDDIAAAESTGGDAEPNPLEILETVMWLDDGLSQLDQRCRGLLLLLYLSPDEPSYAEVAEQLVTPVGSIGPTRARCLERLRRVLGEE
ncbi:MAG: sigma-70 family RNA polymerase sigma factor [Acidimicrobiia bacterium]|nr:sigma-70 family RNA polymerase sigma factor [Acidimicrobiia bacterium]